MADTKSKAEGQKREELYLQQRRALNNAYAGLEGQAYVQTARAFTLEEAIDARIEAIEGKDSPLRPNLKNRVLKVQSDLQRAVDQLKKIPPETFTSADSTKDVNTPEEG